MITDESNFYHSVSPSLQFYFCCLGVSQISFDLDVILKSKVVLNFLTVQYLNLDHSNWIAKSNINKCTVEDLQTNLDFFRTNFYIGLPLEIVKFVSTKKAKQKPFALISLSINPASPLQLKRKIWFLIS